MKTIDRLAFWVSSLDSPIGHDLTLSINAYYRKGWRRTDLAAFFARSSNPEEVPSFAAFNATEAFDYSGVVVATDVHSAASLLQCPGPSGRWLYVSESEWRRRRGDWSYLDFVNVYRNPRLNIIAADEELGRMVADCWNRDVAAVANVVNMNRFLKVIFNGENKSRDEAQAQRG